MAEDWRPDRTADSQCEQWARTNVSGVLRSGASNVDARWFFSSVLKSDLVTLALMFSPVVQVGRRPRNPMAVSCPCRAPDVHDEDATEGLE